MVLTVPRIVVYNIRTHFISRKTVFINADNSWIHLRSFGCVYQSDQTYNMLKSLFLGKISTLKTTLLFVFLVIGSVIMAVGGLAVSIAYRYTTIIPGKLKIILQSVWSYIFYTCLHLFALGFLTYFVLLFNTDRELMVKEAIQYDLALAQFTNEPSFLFIHPDKAKIPMLGLIGVIMLVNIIVFSSMFESTKF